jgi:predicted membrane-bound spermidine synthase
VSTEQQKRLPVYSIALLSATALAYEILLIRFFSIIQWHHYAYMIISLALLGYGASGTFLALFQKRLLQHFPAWFITNIVMFGLSSSCCFVIAQRLPFNPEELVFDIYQWRNLAVIYLTLSIPFFFAANAIGLGLIQYRICLSRIYAADLIGAGFGSLCIVFILFVVFPTTALRILSVLGICAALLAVWETELKSRVVYLLLLCLLTIPVVIPESLIQLVASPYKDLNQALRVTGTRIVEQRSSPLGVISVVESSKIPLRYAPELSLNVYTEPQEQLGLYIDGNGPSVITHVPAKLEGLGYLDQFTSALPYHLKQANNVLVLGAGGGTVVLQALQHGVKHIDAVELNSQVIDLVSEKYAGYAGNLYQDDRVRIINKEARGFLAATDQRFDLIQVPILESFNASAGGLYSLSEDYLYTIEAFKQYLQHLAPDGYLLINRWIKMPPRDTLKVMATVIETLKRDGVKNIAQRLVLIRGWQTSALLVKNGSFTTDELIAVRKFCEQRSFDVSYLPDMRADEANRFNILNEPYYYRGTKELLGNTPDHFLENYKFNLTPATDNQPYFFQFFRWSTLREILSLYGKGGVPLIDTGYLVLVATLIQAITASLILILLPNYFYKRRHVRSEHMIGLGQVLVYFAALGLAFLFIEIAFIQKLMLFLHHPLYAVAVSLTAFLLFAGLGSAYTQRHLKSNNKSNLGIVTPVLVIVALSAIYLLTLDSFFAYLIQLPDIVRIVISVIVIAPLAFCMGMPFPKGLSQLGQHAPDLMSWAWGINGCASVISAVLASLIAMHFGFNIVIAIASLLYIMAAMSFPKPVAGK